MNTSKGNKNNSQTQDNAAVMKQLAETFYEAINNFTSTSIDTFIKENDFYRFVVGAITRKQKNGTFIVDIGDTTISNVVNKSNRVLEIGDTVTILDRFGSNFRNCFILCRNGAEASLEERLLNRIQQLESDVAALKEGGTSK